MTTRGKKLVKLAINKKSKLKSIKDEGKLDVYDNFEEVNIEDPWLDYNKWREAQQQESSDVFFDKTPNYIKNFENSVLYDPKTLVTSAMPIHPSEYSSLENPDSHNRENIRKISEGLEKPVFHELKPVEMSPKLLYTDSNISQNVKSNGEQFFSEKSNNSSFGNSSSSWKPDENSYESNLENSHSGSSKIDPIISPMSSKVSQDITRTSLKRKPPVEHSRRKGRVWDKKDRCAYCNKDVTNFSRHLFRRHANEESVKKILEQPKDDSKRKCMIDLLRKQGNFSIIGEKIIRPVQRHSSKQSEDDVLPTDFLPCKYCKGLYKVKSLRRHAQNCYFNDENKQKINFSSEGQTMMAFTESRQEFLKSLRLKNEVFNKMHADRISFNGKSDPIICQYAEDYLRKHKRPHIKNAVSNKIRELGRLLIPLQDIYKINSMIEMLKPEHYDKVVSASRIISGYNEVTRSFRAPSLALHLKTILLAVCSAAKTLLLKKKSVLAITDYEVALKNVKGFRELVAANWKFEMGSLALKDLNENQFTNPQKLPVTQDIISFRNYTFNVAETCMKQLKTNPEDLRSFKKLTEAALALTIILNRKRIGDVQYTKLEYYNRNSTNSNQEECLNALTESEKQLTKHFKRIVTVGKGSRSVPILFSKPVQEYIETIISVRRITTFVPQENPFLFALTGSSCKWVDGSVVLRKYAMQCGAKNPDTLTSSRLRKQIATVLQILNLSDTEMEQMANFMGHTKKTHEQFYRLPQEVFQTAKIAKLLLMMEKGVGSENKGKTLDEIDVELESWNRQTIKENENDYEVDEFDKPNTEQPDTVPDYPEETLHKKSKVEVVQKPNCRGSWEGRQKSLMMEYFKTNIKSHIAPKKSECLRFKEINLDLFRNKSWVQIKVFVYNRYRNKTL